MMAGRNISASHVAFTSTRVMATCAVIGQAAGTAAALCVSRGLLPRQLWQDKTRLAELQQNLLRDDQTIIGRCNSDPADLARKAEVTASSEVGDAKAEHVINGFVRDVPKRAEHLWVGKMSPDGAWLELTRPQPQKVSQIQITFDTGFQRQLTLTASDSQNRKCIRDPQPETVRDYEIIATDDAAKRRSLVKVQGNHQRLNRHNFKTIKAKSVRLHITATNGADTARVYEVRCYV